MISAVQTTAHAPWDGWQEFDKSVGPTKSFSRGFVMKHAKFLSAA
jgi:hypothetical protein